MCLKCPSLVESPRETWYIAVFLVPSTADFPPGMDKEKSEGSHGEVTRQTKGTPTVSPFHSTLHLQLPHFPWGAQ